MKRDELLMPLLIGAGVFFLLSKNKASAQVPGAGSMTVPQKRQTLIAWVNSTPDNYTTQNVQVFTAMTDQEINDSYNWVFNYALKGLTSSAPVSLRTAIEVISNKYNIFT